MTMKAELAVVTEALERTLIASEGEEKDLAEGLLAQARKLDGLDEEQLSRLVEIAGNAVGDMLPEDEDE